SAIAVSPDNSNLVLVGYNSGDIWMTTNGTATPPNWTKISNGTPTRFVTRLVIDATRTPHWFYATFGGFSADNIYRSTNSGTTWTSVTGSGLTALPSAPVRG